jgi:hypothetical protein
MIDDCPKDHGPDRDRWILSAVQSGGFEASFSEVLSVHGDHEARFWIFSDALKVGGVRVNVSADLQQRIADLLSCSLLTPFLADLAWLRRGATLTPHTRPITSLTSAMVDHSRLIDEDLAKLGQPSGVVSTVGKHWVIDDEMLGHPNKTENYGWHFPGQSFGGSAWSAAASSLKEGGHGLRLIQGRGWAHDKSHVDYSQTCVLVSRTCVVDGLRKRLEDVLGDPGLAWHASHSGPMRTFRQPGVPEFNGRPLDFGPEIDFEALQR